MEDPEGPQKRDRRDFEWEMEERHVKLPKPNQEGWAVSPLRDALRRVCEHREYRAVQRLHDFLRQRLYWTRAEVEFYESIPYPDDTRPLDDDDDNYRMFALVFLRGDRPQNHHREVIEFLERVYNDVDFMRHAEHEVTVHSPGGRAALSVVQRVWRRLDQFQRPGLRRTQELHALVQVLTGKTYPVSAPLLEEEGTDAIWTQHYLLQKQTYETARRAFHDWIGVLLSLQRTLLTTSEPETAERFQALVQDYTRQIRPFHVYTLDGPAEWAAKRFNVLLTLTETFDMTQRVVANENETFAVLHGNEFHYEIYFDAVRRALDRLSPEETALMFGARERVARSTDLHRIEFDLLALSDDE